MRQNDVQERELALSREYESQLLARQEECESQDLGSSTMVYQSLGRISRVLRQLLRSQGGELSEPSPTSPSEPDAVPPPHMDVREPWTTLAAREPWTAPAVTGADHAMEREIELARLEKENEELRRMLGVAPPQTTRPGQGGEGNDPGNFSMHAGRMQHPQPRPFEPPLSLGGFNSPRRPPAGNKTPSQLTLIRRQQGTP